MTTYYDSTGGYPNNPEDYQPSSGYTTAQTPADINGITVVASPGGTITGTDANDVLDGSAGGAFLDGGLGDDRYYVTTDGHVAADAGGIDTIYFSGSGFWRLAPNFENIVADGTGPVDFRGNNDANVMIGGPGDDYMNGRAGDDTFIGNGGDDHFDMSTGRPANATTGVWTMGNRHIDGGEGIDTLDYDGGAGNGAGYVRSAVNIDLGTGTASGGGDNGIGTATLVSIENATGGIYDDTIKGSSGPNQLRGRGGNDTLAGGAGNDVLDGGSGDDTYVFGRGDGRDIIRDSGGTDTVQFGPGVGADQMWLQHSGADLVIHVSGTAEELAIESSNVEQFKSSDGALITESQVRVLFIESQVHSLIAAMAAFAPKAPGATALPSSDAAPLDSIIAPGSH